MKLVSLLFFAFVRIPSSSAFVDVFSLTVRSHDWFQKSSSTALPARSRVQRRSVSRLRSSEDNNKDHGIFGQNLSAAAKERREEERRRAQRLNDAIIGQTSAKKGAKDYAIDPSRTLKELIANSNEVEQEIYFQTERGKTCMNMVCRLS
jgi:hypothetical protein